MKRSKRKVLAALEEALDAYPQLRLGQLIVNVLPPRYGSDPYNVGDEELAGLVRLYVKERNSTDKP